MLRAGRGFPQEIYGQARVPGGLLSQAGRAVLDPYGRPVVIDDFSKPHDWADEDLSVAHGARSGIAVKIQTDALDYGALCVFSAHPREYLPEEVDFMHQAATLLGGGLDRLQKHEAAVAWRSRAELLRSGTALLKVPATRDELLSAAVLAAVGGGAGGARPIADWCFADVLVSNGARPKFGRVAVDHAEGAEPHVQASFSAPLSPTASHGTPRAYATRQPELVGHTEDRFIRAIARDPDHRQAIEDAKPVSYVCAPVVGKETFYGALGFLRVADGTGEPYNKEDLDACTEFAALIGSAIDSGLPWPDIEEARQAVRAHTNGQAVLTSPVEAALDNPTASEREVLELLADGMGPRAICQDLSIAESTYKTHRRHIREKLGLESYCQTIKIVTEARRRGWLPA
ncbi:MAG: GAF domain-containing protein [Rubrobacteraceae bacterium]